MGSDLLYQPISGWEKIDTRGGAGAGGCPAIGSCV